MPFSKEYFLPAPIFMKFVVIQ